MCVVCCSTHVRNLNGTETWMKNGLLFPFDFGPQNASALVFGVRSNASPQSCELRHCHLRTCDTSAAACPMPVATRAPIDTMANQLREQSLFGVWLLLGTRYTRNACRQKIANGKFIYRYPFCRCRLSMICRTVSFYFLFVSTKIRTERTYDPSSRHPSSYCQQKYVL